MNKFCLALLLMCSHALAYAAATHLIPTVHQRATRSISFETGFETELSRSVLNQDVSLLSSDAIEKQTGLVQFQQTSADPNELSINMRGFGDRASANHLLLINGFPYNYSLASPNFSFLPTQAIGRVLLFSGSQGVRYGNGAVGGSLAIKSAPIQRTGVQLGASVGTHDDMHMQLRRTWKLSPENAVEIWTQALHRSTQRDWQARAENTFGVVFQRHKDAHHTRIQLVHDNYSSQLPGSLSASEFANSPDRSDGKQSEIATRIQHMQWLDQWEFDALHRLETRVWLEREDSSLCIGLSAPSSQHQELFFLEERFFGEWKAHHYQLGALFQQHRYHYDVPASSVWQKAFDNQLDAFVEDEWHVNANTRVTLGARESRLSSEYRRSSAAPSDTHPSLRVWELGIERMLSKEHSVYVRRDGQFRWVKAKEGIWSLGNEPLKPQVGESYETGIRFSNDRVNLEAGVFRLNAENEIGFNPEPTVLSPFGSYQNFPHTKRTGVLFHQYWTVRPNLFIQHDLSFISAQLTDTGKRVPGQPALSQFLAVTLKATDEISASYRIHHLGTRYASGDVDNAFGLQASSVVHGVEWSWRRTPWQASLVIDNIFDRLYASYTAVSRSELRYFPANGRSLMLTVRFLG